MKIIYCISGMYKSGGIERVLAGKANYLVSHGYEVAIVTTDQAGRKDFFPIDEQVKRIDLGLNYDELDSLPTWKRYWRTLQMKKTHRALLTEVLQRERADIVVSVLRQQSQMGARRYLSPIPPIIRRCLCTPRRQSSSGSLG